MATGNINGRTYDSCDVEVVLFGNVIKEFNKISYDTAEENQVNHGCNRHATSWSRGKITHTGSIELPLMEAQGIETASNGRLVDIMPFYITVVYLNEYNRVITDVIHAKFKTTGREVGGGMNLSKSYELLVLGIEYDKK